MLRIGLLLLQPPLGTPLHPPSFIFQQVSCKNTLLLLMSQPNVGLVMLEFALCFVQGVLQLQESWDTIVCFQATSAKGHGCGTHASVSQKLCH